MRKMLGIDRFVSMGLTVAVMVMGQTPTMRQASAVTTSAPLLPLAPRTPAAPAATLPVGLASPLALTRVQSAYRSADAVGGRLTLTFTVANLRGPANPPELAPGLDTTGTLQALASFDPARDANTLRNLLFTDVLTPGLNLLAASRPVSQSGTSIQIALGDLAPLSELTVTLTVSAPLTSPDFAALDAGATAWATLQGRLARADAGPAMFAPDALGAYLIWTPDADTRDAWMLRQLGRLGPSPAGLFNFVRGLGNDSYTGSLRGTRGTLWSQAGNSLDKSSLLIALLRAGGTPARYRHGTLDDATAREQITAMFPPLPDKIGYISPGEAVFVPISSTQLMSETRDHWWVEAYLPGAGWTNLDPSFPGATAGQTFYASLAGDGSDQVAEVPDTKRHKVSFRLVVERYGPLSFSAAGLGTIMPLSVTVPTVQLVGNPVSLEHFVDTIQQGGLVFGTTINTYIPYLVIGEDAIDGTAFQDVISSFPLGYELSTAEWLAFDVRHPSGATETFTRTIADLIGVAARAGGGTITNSFGSGTSLVDEGNVYAIVFAPSIVPFEAVNARYPALAAAAAGGESALATATTVTGTEPADIAALQAVNVRLRAAVREAAGAQALWFAANSDFGTPGHANGAHVRAYYDSPRVIIASQQKEKGEAVSRAVLDLTRNRIRAIPYPGQTIDGAMVFNLTWGLMQTELESALMETWHGKTPIGVPAVFAQARAEDVQLGVFTNDNLSVLELLPLSEQAKTRMAQALAGRPDRVVVVPTRMMTVSGVSTVGWYVINMINGRTEDMMENGLRTAAVEYGFLLKSKLPNFGFAIAGFGQGFFAETMFFLGSFLGMTPIAPGQGKAAYSAALASASASAAGLASTISNASNATGGGANEWVECFIDGCDDFEISFGWSVELVSSPIPSSINNMVQGWSGLLNIQLPAPATAGPCSASIVTLSASCGSNVVLYTFDGGLGFNGGVAAAEAFISSHSDPPVPFGFAGRARFTPETNPSAVRRVSYAATHANTTLTGTLSAENVWILQTGSLAAYAPAGASLAVSGNQPGFAPFAGSGAAALTGAGLIAGQGGGMLFAGGVPLSLSNGAAFPVFTGSLALTATAGANDTVALAGVGQFFALGVAPGSSAIGPGADAVFAAAVSANTAAAYTLTAEAPAGWTVAIGPFGAVTATAPMGAAAGDYVVLVTAQSVGAPGVFANARHTVTLGAQNAVQVTLGPDPQHTVSWGTIAPGENRTNPNNGQMQLEGAAFLVAITNTSNTARGYAVSAAGLPAGWGLLSAPVVTLAAGASGVVGLIVSPTIALAGGSAYPFTLTASAIDMALSASASAVFTTPNTAYAHLRLPQRTHYAAPGVAIPVSATLANAGIAAGTFPLTLTVPAGWTHSAPSSASRAAGEAGRIDFSITPTGALFSQNVVRIATRSGPYTIGDFTAIVLVTPGAACAFGAGDAMASLNDPVVTAAAKNLGAALVGLELDKTSPAARDAAVAALNALIAALAARGATPALATLASLSAAMSGHTTAGEIDADLATLCGLLADAAAAAAASAAHAFDAAFTPGADAGVPGRLVTLTFGLTNRGTLSTTFFVTLTSPALGGPVTLNPTLAPGGAVTQPVAVTLLAPGFAPVYADIRAATGLTAFPLLADTALAGATFVSPLLQILEVTPSPAFVDSGASVTALSARIANIANWRMGARASMTVTSPAGGISATASLPFNLSAGNPITLSFGSLNTSGFLTGTYTVTVRAVVTAPAGLAGEASETAGFFAVGQALFATASAQPALVAPGTVTVSMAVTTYVAATGAAMLRPTMEKTRDRGPRPEESGQRTEDSEPPTADGGPLLADGGPLTDEITPVSGRQPTVEGAPATPDFTSAISRTDVSSPAVDKTGTWSTISGAQLANGSSYSRSSAVSSTVAFTFTGVWVSVGWLAGDDGRQFEIFLDGVSQGVIDSYANRGDLPRSRAFGGLANATHVISVSVLSGKNAFAATTAYAKLDYFDVWDGTSLTDGTFEQSDGRVILGDGWTTVTFSGASGGNYARSGFGTTSGVAWFSFSGDSVAYRPVRDFSQAGAASVYVDGAWLADLDLFSTLGGGAATTPTFSFDGLGAGIHVLTLVSRRGNYISLDAFATPGVAPFYSVPTRTGIVRYEENDAGVTFNGFPLTGTKTSWNETADGNASAGYRASSSVASDTVRLTFSGTWASLGYIASSNTGQVEVFVDGVSKGIVDTYGNGAMPRSFALPGLGAGSHTLSVTLLGTRNAFASAPGHFHFDYVDVWDGTAPAEGAFEEDSPRVWFSSGWARQTQAAAGGGAYAQSPLGGGAAWFAFTGDSFTYQSFNGFNNAGRALLSVDGAPASDIDFAPPLTGTTNFTRALTIAGLGAGPHVAALSLVRGLVIAADGFATPGTGAPVTSVTSTGVIRYEENHPAVRYNGAPFTATRTSWGDVASTLASAGYFVNSSASGDVVSLSFSGTWAHLGYLATANAGWIEVFVDGASKGLIDTYGVWNQPRSAAFGGLGAGSHTLSVTVLVTRNAFASTPGFFNFDYLDVWDGSALPDGSFEENSSRVWYGSGWTRSVNAGASGAAHALGPLGAGAVWFPFTGDSVTYQPLAGFGNAGVVNVAVDGAFKARIDLSADFTGTANFTQPVTFAGLGAGPHVLSAWIVRGFFASVDLFATPGMSAPASSPQTGIIRYEEFDPALRYNGAPFTATRQTWGENDFGAASEQSVRFTSAVSDAVSLVFTGTWASLGYVARVNAGRIEVFLDGASWGVIDTYAHDDAGGSVVFAGLPAGAHVISATVLGTRNAYASSPGFFYFDYVDVWDGSAIAAGPVDESSPRVIYSSGWARTASAAAGGGAYATGPLATGGVWIPFSGDSVSLDALAGIANAGEIGVWIDGRFVEWYDLGATQAGTRTLAYTGLGAGPHVLMLANHRGLAISFDGLRTPGLAPFRTAARQGVYRLEEDDPALRYNSAPYTQTRTTWDESARVLASDKYVARTATPSDTVSLTFNGAWASLGFIARADGRQVEVYLDGASQGVVDLYAATEDVLPRVYGGLVSATHTISLSVLSSVNVSATGSNKYAYFDYVDIWDGTTEPKSRYQHAPAEQDGGRIYLSNDWTVTARAAALSGTFIEDGTSAWFLFTGVSVTVIGVTDNLTPSKAELYVDGVSQGLIDLAYGYGRSPVPFTLSGLSAGAHVLRYVDRSGAGSNLGAGLDAFETGGEPFLGLPMVEWTATAGADENFAISPVVGDLDGDGLPEVVATTSDEFCFGSCTFYNRALRVYGGGTGELVFSRTITGTSPACAGGPICGATGSPLIVNLDGGTGVEIIVDSSSGLRAYTNDGTLLWWRQDIQGSWASASAAANLFGDEAPEIAAVDDRYTISQKRILIVNADGTPTWVYTLPVTAPGPRMPVLADFNGDGLLDLFVASGQTAYLFHNNGISMTLAYTRNAGLDHYGAPSVADIDGDGLPEIVIGWTGVIAAYEHDLVPKWVYTTGGQFPSAVSAADLDGNDGGTPELVIYSKTSDNGESGRVFALNGDGTLLWSQAARDTTISSAGVAVLDLDGDGVYEVVWNGYVSGTLIFDGPTGAIEFADETINSGTINETPVIADVDADGHAEVLLVDLQRLVALGFDASWAGARPVWNQHSYHITNIGDDLSVPPREPDSWVYHNTYRTQSPLNAPAPVYYIEISHTLAQSMTLVAGSFTRPYTDAAPAYRWAYKHYWFEPTAVTRLSAVVTGLRPGEVRKVSEATVVSYTVNAGRNQFTLPPLFIAAAHILAVSPAEQTIARGGAARFGAALYNPGPGPAVYTLTVAGVPSSFGMTAPATVTVAAGATVTAVVVITAPAGAPLGALALAFDAAADTSAREAAPATLTVTDGPMATLAPELRAIQTGDVTTYTLTISNAEAVTRAYSVTLEGLGGHAVANPATVMVAGGGSAQATLTVTATGSSGSLIFAVQITNTATGATARDEAVLVVSGERGVAGDFEPLTTTVGLATEAATTLIVSNTGTLDDEIDVTLSAPAGWSIRFDGTGAPTATLTLMPAVLDAVGLGVRVNPLGASAPGTHPITATLRSRSTAQVTAIVIGWVTISAESVAAAFEPVTESAAPGAETAWTLRITNTGAVAASYALTGAGELGSLLRFAALTVSLSSGASAGVPVSLSVPSWAQGGGHALLARVASVSTPAVTANARAVLTVTASGLTATLSPPTIVISDSRVVYFAFVITNTGDALVDAALAIASPANAALGQSQALLPSRFAGFALVSASADRAGVYPITVTVTSAAGTVTAMATLRRTGQVYLPTARK